jgi:hypothetical protein
MRPQFLPYISWQWWSIGTAQWCIYRWIVHTSSDSKHDSRESIWQEKVNIWHLTSSGHHHKPHWHTHSVLSPARYRASSMCNTSSMTNLSSLMGRGG